jgi:outer membrane protein OmpA-like peptidoglycan-associated protein
MRRALRAGALAAVAALLGACAAAPNTRELVVLVPDQGGTTGAVVVTKPSFWGGSSVLLDKPYTTALLEKGEDAKPPALGRDEVTKLFTYAIAAQPERPISFQLYFLEDSDEYTAESKDAFEKVFVEVARRKVAEVAVIGHTDRVGPLEYNDTLSLKRAERVRRDFVDRGIPTGSINVAGRGEREPVVATADEVSEPRNRRVEINVR